MFDGKSLIKNENAFQLLQKIPTTHMGVSNHWTENDFKYLKMHDDNQSQH